MSIFGAEKPKYLVPTWLAMMIIILLSLALSVYALWASYQSLTPMA